MKKLKVPKLDYCDDEIDDIPVGAVESHFLDSGSFTLRTKAAEYAKRRKCGKWDYYDTPEFWEYVDSYAAFINKYRAGIDLYANVDVIPNPELSWRNQQYLQEAWNLRPVPVVHYTTDLKWLKHYINEGHEIIALGGIVGSAKQDSCKGWIDRCFEMVCKPPSRLPIVKIHGFGITNWELLFRYPWYCMTEENHQVLSKSGWKGMREIQVGEEILCYDKGKSIWQRVLEVPQFEVKNADLIHLHNKKVKSIDCCVSWNHRWAVADRDNHNLQGFKETWELDTTDTIPRIGDYECPKDKSYTTSFVKLAAWFWTEGHIKRDKRYKKPSITISQSQSANPKKVAMIRKSLVLSGEKFCEWTSKRKDGRLEVTFQLYGHIRDLLLEELPDKTIQNEFVLKLTKKQLEAFIDISIMADGSKRVMSRCKGRHESHIRQKDWKNIEQFRFACILAGYSTSVRSQYGNPEIRLCRGPQAKFAQVKSLERETVRYTGNLWCVRVPSQAFFVKSNECVFVTGNSVDSTSWTKAAAYGNVFIPHKRRGKFVFDVQPYLISVAVDSPMRNLRGRSLLNLSVAERAIALEWLEFIDVPFGKMGANGEILEYGICNRHTERRAANLHYFEHMRNHLPEYPWPWRSKRATSFGMF